MRASLGVLIAFAAFAFAFRHMGGDWKQLVHLNGALIVLGGPVAMLGSTRAWSRLAEAVLGAGVISVVMGLVHVMHHLGEPAAVGPGVALALVAMLYALASSLVMSQLAQGKGRDDLTPYALLAVTFLLLLVFAVLYALRQG